MNAISTPYQGGPPSRASPPTPASSGTSASASAQAAQGHHLGGAAPGPEHAAAVVAVVVDDRHAADLLGLQPDLRTAGAQPDLDAQHRRRGQLRYRRRGPVDGLLRDLPVRHQQVAAGPPDPAEQHPAAVRQDADAVARRAALEHELVHERRVDQDMLAPDRFHRVVAGQLPGTEPGAIDHDIGARLSPAPDDTLL